VSGCTRNCTPEIWKPCKLESRKFVTVIPTAEGAWVVLQTKWASLCASRSWSTPCGAMFWTKWRWGKCQCARVVNRIRSAVPHCGTVQYIYKCFACYFCTVAYCFPTQFLCCLSSIICWTVCKLLCCLFCIPLNFYPVHSR
jgi:hypothetical protein